MKKKEDAKSQAVSESSPVSNKQLDEFMTVMQPRTKDKTWANDGAPLTVPAPAPVLVEAGITEEKKLNEDNMDVDLNENTDQLDDLQWLQRRTKAVSEVVAKDVNNDTSTEVRLHLTRRIFFFQTLAYFFFLVKVVEVSGSAAAEAGTLSPTDAILQTGRLFLRNLPFSATDEDVRQHFATFGEVSQVRLVFLFLFSSRLSGLFFSGSNNFMMTKHRDIRFWEAKDFFK